MRMNLANVFQVMVADETNKLRIAVVTCLKAVPRSLDGWRYRGTDLPFMFMASSGPIDNTFRWGILISILQHYSDGEIDDFLGNIVLYFIFGGDPLLLITPEV